MNKTPLKNPTNNGGKTDYYAIPDGATTLNDLIEFKRMAPWMHEIFKVIYAFDERSRKGGGFNPEREINKIIYYAERGRNIIAFSQTVIKPLYFSEMTTGKPAEAPSIQNPSPAPSKLWPGQAD